MKFNFAPRLFSNVDFLKLWFAQITSQIGLNALYFILTLKIYTETGSNTAVSLLILTFTAPSIILGYIAGVYVDQLSLKKVMIGANLVRSLVILLLLLSTHYLGLIFLLVLVLAIATLFFIPAEGSAVPSLVEESQLIVANSLFSFTLQTSVVIGFLIGGLSLGVLGEMRTLLGIAILFLISLFLNFFLPAEIRSETYREEHSTVKRFFDGIVFVFTNKKVRDSIFFITMTSTVVFILATIGPGFVDKVLGVNVKYAAGFVILPALVGMGVGAFILGNYSQSVGERRLVNTGLFIMGITFLALTLLGKVGADALNRLAAVVLIFFAGLGNSFVIVPTTTDFQRNSPENIRGRAYGLLQTFISGVAALPILLSGAIGDIFGVRTVLTSLGIVVLSFGLYRLRPKGGSGE